VTGLLFMGAATGGCSLLTSAALHDASEPERYDDASLATLLASLRVAQAPCRCAACVKERRTRVKSRRLLTTLVLDDDADGHGDDERDAGGEMILYDRNTKGAKPISRLAHPFAPFVIQIPPPPPVHSGVVHPTTPSRPTPAPPARTISGALPCPASTPAARSGPPRAPGPWAPR